MPRRPSWYKYEALVRDAVKSQRYENGTGRIGALPAPEDVRSKLNELFKVCEDRAFRVILVEDFGNYKVLINVPDGKSKCDFFVWSATLKEGFVEVKVPSHDDLGEWYLKLRARLEEKDKERDEELSEYLINAVIKLIRKRCEPRSIIEDYFRELDDESKKEIEKFMATLKWIALQEDLNFPPPRYMGSKYTLAVYALLECGFSMSDIRKMIRFGT